MLVDLIDAPVICAPMAGGPSTPALATAVSRAGGLGFLAGGYRSALALRQEMAAVREATNRPFGVNLFVPRHDETDEAAVRSYLGQLSPEAEALGVALDPPTWDDDNWPDKMTLLLSDPVPVVSFTFGCPSEIEVAALQRVGSMVVVTVTSVEEATASLERGVDGLALQGIEAGGHRSRFSDQGEDDELRVAGLLAAVRPLTDTDLIVAGGIMTGAAVVDALRAGASAVQCGTAFLLCPESGTNATHRAALTEPSFTTTAFTTAFSGRSARGLVNRVMIEHPQAPTGYPQINNATKPMRQAAVRAGDPQRANLWAGVGFEQARDEPASLVVARLSTATV